MFTVKIGENGIGYEYMCPFCNQKQSWAGTFVCEKCEEFLELYVEVIDSDVLERIFYYLEGTSMT